MAWVILQFRFECLGGLCYHQIVGLQVSTQFGRLVPPAEDEGNDSKNQGVARAVS